MNLNDKDVDTKMIAFFVLCDQLSNGDERDLVRIGQVAEEVIPHVGHMNLYALQTFHTRIHVCEQNITSNYGLRASPLPPFQEPPRYQVTTNATSPLAKAEAALIALNGLHSQVHECIILLSP